jgi:hypothetical protein
MPISLARVPNGTGALNQVRYAYFNQKGRLAVELNGHVTVYDTLDHQISGVSQQRRGGSLTLTSQHGTVGISTLAVVSVDGVQTKAPEPRAAPASEPYRPDSAQEADLFAKIERLAELHKKGVLRVGLAEAFTPEQLIQQYDVNVSYSTELSLWVSRRRSWCPAPFRGAPIVFAHSGKPFDQARVAEYEVGSYAGIADKALKGLAGLEPADADPSEVARQIARVIDLALGKRLFGVHVDPSEYGAEIVNGVADRMRREMYRNMGLGDLLHPTVVG